MSPSGKVVSEAGIPLATYGDGDVPGHPRPRKSSGPLREQLLERMTAEDRREGFVQVELPLLCGNPYAALGPYSKAIHELLQMGAVRRITNGPGGEWRYRVVVPGTTTD